MLHISKLKEEAKRDSQSGYREIGMYIRSCQTCLVMQLFQEKDSFNSVEFG